MKIKESSLLADMLGKIKYPDLIEGEDILIENENGELVGVIIQPKAYEFFLRKLKKKRMKLMARWMKNMTQVPKA